MSHQCSYMGVRVQGGKAGGSEVIRERGGSEGITMTDIYPSVQLSGKRLSGTVRAISDTGEAPTLTAGPSRPSVRQLVQRLQKQIQGSGFILPAGLTSGPPLKSSSRCLRETNEK